MALDVLVLIPSSDEECDDRDDDDVMMIKALTLPRCHLKSKRRDEEEEDVVIIEKLPCPENRTKERRKGFLSSCDLAKCLVDEECCIIDAKMGKVAPEKTFDLSSDSDDIIVTGEKGENASRDFPHARHLCVKHPFRSSSHEIFCGKCHCYVCDMIAPCLLWGDGTQDSDHCHASDREERWKVMRQWNKFPLEQPVMKYLGSQMIDLNRRPPMQNGNLLGGLDIPPTNFSPSSSSSSSVASSSFPMPFSIMSACTQKQPLHNNPPLPVAIDETSIAIANVGGNHLSRSNSGYNSGHNLGYNLGYINPCFGTGLNHLGVQATNHTEQYSAFLMGFPESQSVRDTSNNFSYARQQTVSSLNHGSIPLQSLFPPACSNQPPKRMHELPSNAFQSSWKATYTTNSSLQVSESGSSLHMLNGLNQEVVSYVQPSNRSPPNNNFDVFQLESCLEYPAPPPFSIPQQGQGAANYNLVRESNLLDDIIGANIGTDLWSNLYFD